ncbi:MAG: diaminopimelate epimerase [Lachnospiraceae bacterium]|nr:diaminopimelate epimerase [Lachnospiraceae bacterium]
MKFVKMHGCGNDYIYVNSATEKMAMEDKPEFIRRVSRRHFGVGSDGVIFINPSEKADFEMEMWNADGTRGEMCGNGIRCVGKFVYDFGLTDKVNITVESGGQIKYLNMTTENGKVKMIRVNMGSPILEPAQIPVKYAGDKMVAAPIEVGGKNYEMTCVSMGNPHAVVFVEDVQGLDLVKIGPDFENHEIFPKRTNTEFVKVIDRNTVEMRVWERGSGETLACGTGCCATAVACILNGFTEDAVTVKVLGGELLIEWDRDENIIYMTGPAETVFVGEVE